MCDLVIRHLICCNDVDSLCWRKSGKGRGAGEEEGLVGLSEWFKVPRRLQASHIDSLGTRLCPVQTPNINSMLCTERLSCPYLNAAKAALRAHICQWSRWAQLHGRHWAYSSEKVIMHDRACIPLDCVVHLRVLSASHADCKQLRVSLTPPPGLLHVATQCCVSAIHLCMGLASCIRHSSVCNLQLQADATRQKVGVTRVSEENASFETLSQPIHSSAVKRLNCCNMSLPPPPLRPGPLLGALFGDVRRLQNAKFTEPSKLSNTRFCTDALGLLWNRQKTSSKDEIVLQVWAWLQDVSIDNPFSSAGGLPAHWRRHRHLGLVSFTLLHGSPRTL